ncbi:MAG: hypothetical protein IKL38_06095, partial [Firmicutes bacterium]|nr:hypothetical protein [Bacillota bacterium]
MRYSTEQPLSKEIMKKLILSRKEVSQLDIIDLRCPYCIFIVDRIYSDAAGHRESKCPKCKNVTVYYMAYFRR